MGQNYSLMWWLLDLKICSKLTDSRLGPLVAINVHQTRKVHEMLKGSLSWQLHLVRTSLAKVSTRCSSPPRDEWFMSDILKFPKPGKTPPNLYETVTPRAYKQGRGHALRIHDMVRQNSNQPVGCAKFRLCALPILSLSVLYQFTVQVFCKWGACRRYGTYYL